MRRREFMVLLFWPWWCRLGVTAETDTSGNASHMLLQRLETLRQQSPNRFLLGQNIGSSNRQIEQGYQRFFERLALETGRLPVVLAADYGYDKLGPGIKETNSRLIEHARSGGMVTISFHPPNPWRGTTCNDTKVGDLDVLLQSGTAANRRWLGMLDRVATGLRELQEAGVVVLFRPLHEMNGNWFWWSHARAQTSISPAQFARLWQYLHQHMTETCQLDNLLWVYGPSARYDTQQLPVRQLYPGDAWVDIVGLDYYGDPMSQALGDSLRDLSQLSKPLAICEFGFSQNQPRSYDNLRLVRALEQHKIPVQYVVYWHSWSNIRVAIIDHDQAEGLLQHPHVITREQMW